MRIIAGTHRSRRFAAPEGRDTRPTLDKVREAVFSSLGGFFDGGAVLDLYAGSGAVGFEALSRGMEQAVFVDSSRKASLVIRQNTELLGFEARSRILAMRADKAVCLLSEEGAAFDLVYLDPPYRLQENVAVLNALCGNGLLKEDAAVVVESLKEETYPEAVASLRRTKEAVYGITRITYYRNRNE